MSLQAKTQPDHYEGILSEESSHDRAKLENELEACYAELDGLTGVKRLRMLKEINRREQQLAWQGANPKVLDKKELKEHVHAPDDSDDPLVNKYKERIKNRATAIRAYCVWCQGGMTAEVRRCPSVTCVLHPFRMGKDPLRGYELPKAEPVIIEGEDETEDQFEDDEDDGEEDDDAEI